ncbi:MAG: hypothetical protein HKN21_16970 [Candidatus Eisenbacteria bacterium]|uniref:peptidylprolyl isomerase n=1 Tax=Eiseniibacteriota bacterium TaxID=2212470 RepID=A0A7Y2EAY8_UNCEI|nr:hypothetical protein [Candidatus Eisenbacteria bacterium]
MNGLVTRLVGAGLVLAVAVGVPPMAKADIDKETLKEILIHEHSRNLADGYLLNLLETGDEATQLRVLQSLASIQDISTLDAITDASQSESAEVRNAAFFAISQMFRDQVEPILLEALNIETDPTVRQTIILGLGKSGTETSVPVLAEILSKNDKVESATAAHALGLLGQRSFSIEDAGPALIQALRSPHREITWRAAFAVQRGKCVSAASGLHRALQSKDTQTKIFACRAVGALKRQKLSESVVPLFQDEDWRVRVEALRAIGDTRNKFFASRASLLLDDPNNSVVLTAIETMGKLGGEGLSRIMDYEFSSDWQIRSAYLMARAQASGEGALLALRDGIRDADWRIRMAAATAFARVPTEQALLVLEPVVQDEMPQVQAAAINSLVQFPQIEAVKFIRPGIKSDDIAVMTSAASAAGQRFDREAVGDLVAAYRNLVSPVDSEAMIAILQALGTILAAGEDDGAIGTLNPVSESKAIVLMKEALEDTDYNVATRASQSLALIEGTDPVEVQARPSLPENWDLDAIVEAELNHSSTRATLVTTRGEIVIDLNASVAPATVANFLALAKEGYYDGLRFHRVVADFVVQTGDPRGDGWGGPGYAIRCEYSPLTYKTGTVGMAHAGKDTGGSQFFVTHSPQPHLDGRYTVFGQVVEGQEVVDKIRIGDKIQEIRLETL